jgi:hypothetical protein
VPPEHFSAGNHLESDIGSGSLHSHFLNYDLQSRSEFYVIFFLSHHRSHKWRGVSRISLQFALYQNCQLIPESYRGAYWGLLVLGLRDKYTVSWRSYCLGQNMLRWLFATLHSTPLCSTSSALSAFRGFPSGARDSV